MWSFSCVKVQSLIFCEIINFADILAKQKFENKFQGLEKAKFKDIGKANVIRLICNEDLVKLSYISQQNVIKIYIEKSKKLVPHPVFLATYPGRK